ncbi:flagellar basal body-associated FliL family protein [Stakelama tenebrarum]|uniref:Flagellar protein FliL n=1 Tax=Stakelama tenebrarum TaxID=2711215 RepID=A0A6G6Y2C7_9SPHN|nr:flagellar basal body-associated FliL family protein [Sphingosinithalassobacter tenebrarum]QIG78726.1 flagellar basal body-associated FliL family protein [Sphingosinithalassobacter tenebrarum]
MAEDATEDTKPKKKKGGFLKLILLVIGLTVLIGGGVGGGLYAAQAGWLGGSGGGGAGNPDEPHLVPKSEQKRAAEAGGDHGGGEGGSDHDRTPTPEGEGGEEHASNYYTLEKEFTSNLQNSVHFIQVGIAVATHYDDRVIENLRTHEIAVRSAVLMALSETTEDQVFTSQGKRQLQKRLVDAINAVLKQKEGFGGIGNVYFTNFIVQ